VIAKSLGTAVDVLASFGLSDRTLIAENVLVPIAYYIKCRGLQPSYAVAGVHAHDRELVRSFVARTLLKQGFWTGAVEPILREARTVLKSNSKDAFPLDALAKAFARKAKKPITFSATEIDDLMATSYSHRRALLMLQLLYPDVRAQQQGKALAKDHVFPRRLFNTDHFRTHGVVIGELDDWRRRSEQLPNLQLLDPADNINKAALLPAHWLSRVTGKHRAKYRVQDLGYLPEYLSDFEAFWDTRHLAMASRLRRLLGVKV